MTVKEARDSFDRMLEAAKREGILLRDGNVDLAVIVSPEEYARLRWSRVFAGDRPYTLNVILSAAKDLIRVATGDEVLRCAQDDICKSIPS